MCAAGLDHVRVERSLHEPPDVAERAGLLLEDADELLADALPLLLGILDPREPREKAILRVHVDERNVEVPAERLDHLLSFVLTQETVVDEHAGQLIADGLVHEQRRDGRVDAAGEGAQHALGADLGPNALSLLLDDCGRRPRRRRPGSVVKEVLQDVLPVRRVHDFGMELHAVEGARGRLERGDRRRRRARDHNRVRGWRDDGIAMGHPNRLLARRVVEQP